MGSLLPEYELFAIRYATREAKRSDHFIGGDPHDGPMAMDYFVWVAVGPERTFLIDTGFSAESAAKRRRAYLGCPIESLKLLGIDPASVGDVILTHLHYDHAGNANLLPAAEFHLQESELHFATGRHIRYRYFSLGYDVEDIVTMVRMNYARRIKLYNGHVDLAPGVWLEPAPGHAAGQQIVGVHTRRGWVVIASDSTHYYENILRHRPHVAAVDIRDVLESYDKVLSLAASIENVIPGHDPLVMDIYPPSQPEFAGKIARLDVKPRELPLKKPTKNKPS